jgi:hypothetical protein
MVFIGSCGAIELLSDALPYAPADLSTKRAGMINAARRAVHVVYSRKRPKKWQ